MSLNSVNFNNMTLAEKIKLMQMQKSGQTPTATLGSNVNKMNTSIFASTKTAMSQAVANPQNPQVTLKDNNDNVFSQLNMVSGNQQTTSKSELYENPENITTTQDITKAQVQLQTRMAKSGTNPRLEDLSARLEARRNEITSTGNAATGTNTTENKNETNSTDAAGATSNAESSQAQGEKKTSEAQDEQKEARSMSKDAKADAKALTKDSKNLNKQMKAAQRNIQKSGQEMDKLTAEMDKNQEEIDAYTQEINTLQAEGADSTGAGERSAFSLKLAGDDGNNVKTRGMNSTASAQSTTSSDDTQAKIDNLNSKIDEKVASNTSIGVRMNTIKTTQNKSVTTMQNTVRMKDKYYTKMLKNNQTQDKLTDKMLKAEQKINDAMVTVEKVGKTTEQVGKLTFAAGSAMACYPPTSAAGQTMMNIGTKAQKIGSKVQMVGQYGQAAAQAAISLTYTAQGDIGKALSSASTAVQVGANAVKTNKEMSAKMAELDGKLQAGMEKSATAAAAQEAAKQAKADGTLGDMSKKEYAKNAKAQLDTKVENNELTNKDILAATKGDNAGVNSSNLLDKSADGNVDTSKLKNSATARKDAAKAQKAAKASSTSANGKKQSVFSKGADFLAKNGDKISGALNSAAQKLSKKDTQTQSNPQVARTTTTGTVASAAQMNELARRKKMMGL